MGKRKMTYLVDEDLVRALKTRAVREGALDEFSKRGGLARPSRSHRDSSYGSWLA